MQPFELMEEKDLERTSRTRYELYMRLLGNKEEAKVFLGKDDYTEEELLIALDKLIQEQINTPMYVNDQYSVLVTEYADVCCLSIRRLDRDTVRDWRHLQEIKNMLVGPENEGIEIFPAESRLVDTANQYYLWVFKDPKFRVPFGFSARLVTDNALSTTRQRKRN